MHGPRFLPGASHLPERALLWLPHGAQMNDTGYREAFQIFDVDNDGIVSPPELKKMMAHLGNPLTDQEIKDILKEAGSNGAIDYHAFTKLLGIGLKQSREADPEEELHHAFKLFDKDGDGVISAAEMTNALNGFGVKLTEREVDQLIGEATLSQSRSVNYDVFKRVMTANR